MAWIVRQGRGLAGLVLIGLVAMGTILLSPLVAQGLEALPGLTYLYTDGVPIQRAEREEVEPLPFNTVGVSTADLLEIGLPVAPGPSFSEVDRSVIFPKGHAITDAANEQMILSARRALWVWDTVTPGFGAEIMIVELPTQSWARSLAHIWELDESGGDDYPADATWAVQRDDDTTQTQVMFVHGRLWVVVQMGAGSAYFEAVAQGEAEPLDLVALAKEVSLAAADQLPRLHDLAGWESLDVGDVRLENAASLGVAATLTLLARTLGTAVFDRGSREAVTGRLRRRAHPLHDDVLITPIARQRRLRSFVLSVAGAAGAGAGIIVVYFVSGTLGLVPMFLCIGAGIVVLVVIATLVRPHDVNDPIGRGWQLSEALASATSAIVVAAGIFCVGTAGVGFTMGEGSLVRGLSLLMLVLGLAIVGLSPYPARAFRRLAMPAVKRALALDERAPVLFLRSFQDDDLTVRIHASSRPSPSARLALLRDSTFEDLVAWQAAQIGPVIAIGQPGTQLQPLGAVRDYFSDDTWKTAVLNRITDAISIIFVVGRSPGAQWELAQLRDRGALGKTLFVFPPVPEHEFYLRCGVLAVGLGIDPERLIRDEEQGVPLVAMRIGERGEIIRYLSDGRDDIAYRAALDLGLEGTAGACGVVFGPAGARPDPEAIAEAKSLLATYDPRRRRARSSDPFLLALGLVIGFVD